MSKFVAQKVYSPEMIIRAFKYLTTSRTLYHKLREGYQLPYISTHTRLTLWSPKRRPYDTWNEYSVLHPLCNTTARYNMIKYL